MTRERSRRDFLRTVGTGAGAAILGPTLLGGLTGCRTLPLPGTAQGTNGGSIGWARVPEILLRIVPPVFPERDFDITRYGARGDGATDCSAAIRDAIGACSSAGGGRVVIPEGRFLTGPVHLRSNVNLHLSRGATLAFSTDAKRYLPAVLTRWEGMEMMGYSPFIYAFEQENIAITGEGTLDGQSGPEHWWPWHGKPDDGWKTGEPSQVKARMELIRMVEAAVPVDRRLFAEGSYLRPQFIQPYRCRNVLIEGVSIVSSPMWEVHPVLCTNVTVRNLRINSHGPNNDGCDPESCRDVLIEGCVFDTGDDCIAIKSGRNADGRRLHAPTEDVIVRGCRMKDGHGGVTIGSEISGDVRHVYVERCEMDSPNLDRALRLKNNAMRGGTLEHIYMRNVTVGELADAVLQVDFLYEEGANGPFAPVVRDVEMRNVTSRKSRYGLYLRAYPKSTIADIRLVDCRFDGVAKGNIVEQVQGLALNGVTINGRNVDAAAVMKGAA